MKKILSLILSLALLVIYIPGIYAESLGGYKYLDSCCVPDPLFTNSASYNVCDLDDSTNMSHKFTYSVPDEGAVVLVFFRVSTSLSGNEFNLLSDISKAEWINNDKIKVIAVESSGAVKDDVQTYITAAAGSNSDRFKVHYSNKYLLGFYLNKVLNSSSYFPPLMFVISNYGGAPTVRYYSEGAVNIAKLTNSLASVSPSIAYDNSAYTVGLKVSGEMLYDTVSEIHRLVNENRAAEGHGALALSGPLTELAMQRAAECAAYYNHTRPNGDSCFTVDENGIYTIGYVNAENIAAGYRTAAEVMNGWMNSSGHRKNIMNSDSGSIGIGAYKSNDKIYWVQLFGVGADSISPQISEPVYKEVTVEITYELAEAGRLANTVINNIELIVDQTMEIPKLSFQNQSANWMQPYMIPFTEANVTDDSGSVIATVTVIDGKTVIKGVSAGTGTLDLCLYDGDQSPITVNVTVSTLSAVLPNSAYGDVDGNGVINGKDLIRLRKYLSFGGSVDVFNGIDANGDSRINGLDLVTLRKYFAGYNDDTGISSYELGPR